MKRLLAGVLFPLVIMGCATHRGPRPVPKALVQEDPFDASYKVTCDTVSGKTVCVMTGNALHPFNPRYPMLSLGVISEQDAGGPPRYLLRTVFVNVDRWLNIGRGKTLSLHIDGETVELSGKGSRGNRFAGERGKVYEVALYDVPRAIIEKIAGAGEVAVGLRGDFLVEKRFGTVNNLYFQQFVRHYIEKTPVAPK